VTLSDHSAQAFNEFGTGHLPGLIGIEVLSADRSRVTCRVPLRQELMAPNGFLHAGTLVSVADSLCGYGAVLNLPDGATGFTTIELKSNFLGTLHQGAIACEATPLHLGRNTQVWDAVVGDEASGRRLAVFRCTQMVLWPKG
jgi:1,4-dihydroxy-2-naphthoyl-CoA hydrolase